MLEHSDIKPNNAFSFFPHIGSISNKFFKSFSFRYRGCGYVEKKVFLVFLFGTGVMLIRMLINSAT